MKRKTSTESKAISKKLTNILRSETEYQKQEEFRDYPKWSLAKWDEKDHNCGTTKEEYDTKLRKIVFSLNKSLDKSYDRIYSLEVKQKISLNSSDFKLMSIEAIDDLNDDQNCPVGVQTAGNYELYYNALVAYSFNLQSV